MSTFVLDMQGFRNIFKYFADEEFTAAVGDTILFDSRFSHYISLNLTFVLLLAIIVP